MSDIVKICKSHGPLSAEQVRYEKRSDRPNPQIRCIQCKIEKDRKWKENHREQHIEASKKWKRENKERVNEWAKQDREKNPEKYKIWSKTTKTNNRDKILKKGREYQMKKRYENYDESLKKEAEYRNNNSQKLYISHVMSRYKVSKEEAVDFLEKFDDLCTICRKPETRKNAGGKISRLCIDHCHETGKLRGLLCHNCNNAIGAFKDSIALLQAAIDYLKKYGADNACS